MARHAPLNHWWHELNTWEPEQAISFYERTLGWKFEAASLPGGDYWIAHKDGVPVGGIFALSAPQYDGIPSHWMTYMAVRDIDEAEHNTAFAGGEVTRPATIVPGVGKLAVVTDSSGAMVGLIEPDPEHALSVSAWN